MNTNETKTYEPTPEQLLKMLDLQMRTMRSKRADTGSKMTLRIVSIVFVLIAAAGALFYLMMTLDDFRAQRASGAQNTGIKLEP